jgi:hypothetical protein
MLSFVTPGSQGTQIRIPETIKILKGYLQPWKKKAKLLQL